VVDQYVLSLGGLTLRWDDPDGGAALLTLEGELDGVSLPVLGQTLEGLYREGCFDVSIDLAGVEFIDSSGLGALVAAWRRCRDEGGRAVARNPSAPVRRLMDLTGISRFLLPAD
jgi:anti-sigma B factor antagonist